MNVVEISINEFTEPADILENIKAGKLKMGDTLHINAEKKTLFIVVFLIVIYFVLKKYFNPSLTDNSDAGRMLDNIVSRKSSAEIEKEIENKFGINIEIQVTNKEEEELLKEKNDWMQMTTSDFAQMYSNNEPDYSDVPVREPNPEYIKWKKDK